MFLCYLLLACSLQMSCGSRPAVVPVTEDQVTAEAERLNQLGPNLEAEAATADLIDQATEKYHGRPFALCFLGTDSTTAGVDSWRTCEKLKVEQLGLPADTLAVFFDEHGRPCSKNPGGIVASMTVAGPLGLEQAITNPIYKMEVMTVMVGIVATSEPRGDTP